MKIFYIILPILLGVFNLKAQNSGDSIVPSFTIILNDSLVISELKTSNDADSLSAMLTIFRWNPQCETSLINDAINKYRIIHLDFTDNKLEELPIAVSSIKELKHITILCEKLKKTPTSLINNQDNLLSLDLHTNMAIYSEDLFNDVNFFLLGLWSERNNCKLIISKEKNFITKHFLTDVKLTKRNASSIVNINANCVTIMNVNRYRKSIKYFRNFPTMTIWGKLNDREIEKIKFDLPQAIIISQD